MTYRRRADIYRTLGRWVCIYRLPVGILLLAFVLEAVCAGKP